VARSLLGTVSLAATVLFAAPIALAGAFELAAGNHPMGVVFLVLAALMIALEEYLLTPSDLPVAVVRGVTRAVLNSPGDGNGEEDGEEREE
jgi:hypothetical protein